MTVVDIRNVRGERNIEIFHTDKSHIYYSEEKNDNGKNELYIMEYDRNSRRERLITNYTLEDPTFVEHIFAFEETMILILENGKNSLWLIELSSKDGTELNRRKVVCTGSFRSCLALDEDHVLIYMGPDEANKEMFEQYRTITGCECLCYLYDLRSNVKHFVKNQLIARLGTSNIKLMNVHGIKYAVLLDPFSDEDIKRGYYEEQRWINVDIRDNIWLCTLSVLENELESDAENITKKCIASADIKALARYMGTDKDKVYFRAKEFRTGQEKICSYDVFTGALAVEADLTVPENSGINFILEERPFSIFALHDDKMTIGVKGLVGSKADLRYKASLGKFVTCIDARYIITRKNPKTPESAALCSIYDSETHMHEEYECSCYLSGSTVVLY